MLMIHKRKMISMNNMENQSLSSMCLPVPSRERLTELFLYYSSLPSPSGDERLVADAIVTHLSELNLSVREDESGTAIKGNTGNLYCLVEGLADIEDDLNGATASGGASLDSQVPADISGPHILFCAHMDTVPPADDIVPILENGLFRNSKPTILGADDKVAIVALLHAIELLVDSNKNFPTFELLFTVSEETGLSGIKQFDTAIILSPMAAVFDASGPVGGITSKAPTQKSFSVTFRGKAAHAGVEPENGRSAIQAAASSIAKMQLGRIGEETSANIGLIQGGVAGNIVPEWCELKGECRSHNQENLAQVTGDMIQALQLGAAEYGVDVDISLTHEYTAFALPDDSAVVRLSKAALEAIGLVSQIKIAGGGSDANLLNGCGLPTANLDAGMMLVHSSDEYVRLDDLEMLCALILQMIYLAPGFLCASTKIETLSTSAEPTNTLF